MQNLLCLYLVVYAIFEAPFFIIFSSIMDYNCPNYSKALLTRYGMEWLPSTLTDGAVSELEMVHVGLDIVST